jgi:hypothetical protein
MDQEDAPEVTRTVPAAVPDDVAQAANHLARRIHYEGAVSRFQVERMLTGMSRRISIDSLLDFAASNGWLIINGQRIIPGEICPELVTSARFVPAGDGVGTY